MQGQSRTDLYFQQVFDASYVQYPPYFPPGSDSAMRFYFSHFKALDTILHYSLRHGDTGVFIRIHFSFIIDENGILYEPLFEKITAVASPSAKRTKTLSYFSGKKIFFQKATTELLQQMPMWKPAIQYGRPVKCQVKDYLQLRVGK